MPMAMLGSPQATKGKGCSGYHKTHPHKCIHTRLVAATIRPTTEDEGGRLDETQAAPEALGPGEEEDGLHVAGATDAPEEENGSRRTAASLIKKNVVDYGNNLRNTFHLMAIYKFPPRLPSSLPREPCCESEGDTMKFKTTQRSCSRCGRELTASKASEGKL